MYQTVVEPHVRLDMSFDHPAAALIAVVVIGTLTRSCGDTAAARNRRWPTRWAPALRPAGSFQGGEMIYNWRVYDAVAAHDPSRVYPANSGSCPGNGGHR